MKKHIPFSIFLLAATVYILLLAASVQGATASFNFTGSMTVNRENHTATLLTNGMVLVAGGITNADTGGIYLSTTELFNPTNGTWTVTGVMSNARAYHTATRLPNGKVLVVGGAGVAGILSSVELYDPDTGSWTLINSMKTARAVHSATLLTNGMVLVAGGSLDGINPLSSAELYDPGTGNWRLLINSMNTARAYQTATLLTNGIVLVVGGASGTRGANAIPGAELYDPATEKWTVTDLPPNTPRGYGHTATLLTNGKVLVVAGGNGSSVTDSAELYDPIAGAWTYTGSLTTGARHSHTATLLPDGTVLIAGGDNQTDGPLSNAEVFDPAIGTWTATGSLKTSREWHTATSLPDGNVMIAGGAGVGTGSPAIASAELYNSTITIPAVVLSEPQLTIGNNNFTFLLSGPAGSNYLLQVSSNLLYWSPVSTSSIPTSGIITLTNAISGFNQWFYRAYLQ